MSAQNPFGMLPDPRGLLAEMAAEKEELVKMREEISMLKERAAVMGLLNRLNLHVVAQYIAAGKHRTP